MMSGPAELIGALVERGETVATAESLTGGLVCAALTEVSGSSAAVRGGVVAYATDVKQHLLDVDGELLARGGAVQEPVAAQLAEGVRRRLGTDWGLATTGVAGPSEQDGQPVGRVFIAVSSSAGTHTRRLDLGGDRAAVRAQTVDAVLALCTEIVGPSGEHR